MSSLLTADQPNSQISSEIDDDSEICDGLSAKIIREARLRSIAFHKHLHVCNKALGLSTSETPLSIIEESLLFDSDNETQTSDSRVSALMETAGGEEGQRTEGQPETAVEMEEQVLEEMSPAVKMMMEIYLPRFFDLVRSFLFVFKNDVMCC